MQGWIFEIRSRTFFLLVAAFLAATALVGFGITEWFDHGTIEAVEEGRGGPLEAFMLIVTESGDIHYMLGFSIILLLIKRTRRLGLALMILLVLATLSSGYIKCGVDRDRPEIPPESDAFPIIPGRDTFSLFCEGGYAASFPSGHAARAAAFGAILGFVLSERFPRGCYLLLLYPALMAVSRVYVMQHYPMDVIGGAILGVLLAGYIGHKTKLYRYLQSKTE